MAPKNNGGRPFVFPALKVDGVVHDQEIVIANTGQDILRAQQQAATKIRQIRAAKKASVPAEGDSAEVKDSTVPTEGDSHLNSGASAGDGIPVLSTADVEPTIREWLAAHLPSNEQLLAAGAAFNGLQGVFVRVEAFVQSFKDGLDGYRQSFTAWRDQVQKEWLNIAAVFEGFRDQWERELKEIGPWKEKLRADLIEQVSKLRGPQGKVGPEGMAGRSMTLVDRLPKGKGADLLFPYIGRNAVMGDIAVDGTTDMRYAWRWTGQNWERGPAMTSLQVRDVRVSALNTGDQVTTTQSIQRTGGGAGGGGEVLLTDRASQSWVTIADASNWSAAGFFDPTAGKLMLELTDLADARRGVVTLDFSAGAMAGQTALTESAMTGAIFDNPASAPDVDFDVIRMGAPIIPTGVTGTPILAGGATQVRVRIGANLGGTKQYAIAGSVWWARKSEGKIANPDDVTRQPLWSWQ